MRIICLDIGSKRIGVAASDPLGWTAQGVEVIERKGNKKDMERICEICREWEAEKIVAGLPLNEEGEIGPAAKKIQGFVDKLKVHLEGAKLDIDVEMWDERYSTAIAEERLIEADVSRKKRKRVIDKMAATVILQDYLEANEISTDVDESAEG
ncbi:MAG: Holliday junction resolvase RuvX [Deltaproteobacteria bacterium]|jgi:putative holliday junction resolvase|nr:Holliday junction resolvase RuvX [Deltaproteobacteria bacterium]